MDLFHDFARVGVAVLIATHDLSLIARYRHRLLTLREGRLIHDGEEAASQRDQDLALYAGIREDRRGP